MAVTCEALARTQHTLTSSFVSLKKEVAYMEAMALKEAAYMECMVLLRVLNLLHYTYA